MGLTDRIIQRHAAADMKQVVEKILHAVKADLKKFVASLPPGSEPLMGFTSESRPMRGGYGPYEVGEIHFGGFIAKIVADVPKGTIGVGAYSGPHALESLMSGSVSVKEFPPKLKKVIDWFKDRVKRDAEQKAEKQKLRSQTPEPEETWSVVQLGMDHGYATDVNTYSTKSKAIDAAKDAGGAYVLRGTQMWNEPLGQIEESDRPARTQWVKG